MPRTISKGRMFTCFVEVDDSRLAAMKKSPEAAGRAVQAGADFWHSSILPLHFEAGAHGRYGYARRALKYLKEARKSGKPDLVLSGSLRDDLKARAAYKVLGGGIGVELKMSARVLNLVPRMGENDVDLYVKQSNGRSYPNLKREVKAITDDEREAVANVIARELERAFDPQGAATADVQRGLSEAGTVQDAIESFFGG